MIRIAVSSQKGGVGKTTLSINLAHAFARAGVRTLLVDADPQGSVGLSLTRQAARLPGFYDYLTQPSQPLAPLIVNTRMPTFSLITCGELSGYEEGGGGMGSHIARINSLLHGAERHGFELCLIDTAAGLFGVSADVILASQALLIPQQSEPLGIRSLPKMLSGLERLQIMNPQLAVLGVCLTMVQPECPESLQAAAELRQQLPPSLVLQTQIPRDPLFMRASARGLPVGLLKDGASAAATFDHLRHEVQAKLRGFGIQSPNEVPTSRPQLINGWSRGT